MQIKAKVITNAKYDSLNIEEDVLKIRITEVPVKGKANKAIEEFIKAEVGCNAQIVLGAKNNNKVIWLDCSEQELLNKIGDINGKNIH